MSATVHLICVGVCQQHLACVTRSPDLLLMHTAAAACVSSSVCFGVVFESAMQQVGVHLLLCLGVGQPGPHLEAVCFRPPAFCVCSCTLPCAVVSLVFLLSECCGCCCCVAASTQSASRSLLASCECT